MTRGDVRSVLPAVALGLVAASCAPASSNAPSPSAVVPAREAQVQADATITAGGFEPALPPRLAMFAGLMPLRSIGVDAFRMSYPELDGRGVLIGILDSGVDPSLAGLQRTSTGDRKVVDVRDFSGEGRIALEPVSVGRNGTAAIGAHRVEGLGRVRGVAVGPYLGGRFHERRLGAAPAADVNGDGDIDDEFAIIVGRASDGWVVFVDADGDGSFADEGPLRDYAVAHETIRFRTATGANGPMTVAVNLAERDGAPALDLVMDNSSHGSHVAGIAAGHGLFGVEGFDGVAPGAQVLALKIANNTRGGISVSGSMLRALQYAAAFAAQRDQPLVLNLSYGVGNEIEGAAAIDTLLDRFTLDHPDILVVISAGNDGPGLSTVGLPGSADQTLTVCALFPGVFARPLDPTSTLQQDVLGWWSARGGEVAKPDVCAAGVAYSNVPAWRAGEEISGGTSMAAPQVAGAAALLQSGLLRTGHRARAVDLKRALMATAKPTGGTTVLDEGRGVVDVSAAYQWLRAAHQTGVYRVRALPDGGNTSKSSAAYRRTGLATRADTIQRFEVTSLRGQAAARLLLTSDVPWIRTPTVLEPSGGPATVELTYDAAALVEPGLYVGTVWATAASDTLAGPAFGLTNTVVVPHDLLVPFSASGMLTPGATVRYFVATEARQGGLTVTLDVDGPDQQASLYLFEPSGQPHRGGSNAIAGLASDRAEIVVREEDLVPGVYEVVVVAPPVDPAGYLVTATQPGVGVVALDSGPLVTVRNSTDRAVRTEVRMAMVGATQRLTVTGGGTAPESVTTRVPEWAQVLVLEVSTSQELWHKLTDLGMTVFDSLGNKISDSPLNYAVGRHAIPIDSARVGDRLDVEVFPAFALPEPDASWSVDIELSYLTDQPIPIVAVDSAAAATVSLVPSASALVEFGSPATRLTLPDGFTPLFEVSVTPEGRPTAVRRGTAMLAPPPAPPVTP